MRLPTPLRIGRRAGALLLLGALWLPAFHARADVVDDAFKAGNEAARSGDWATAIKHYREAEGLLPGRSAELSFNLGTAHAQLGDNGPAVFNLRRALQSEARPSAEIAEAARRNLGIVRQRMEVAAATSGAQIDRPEGWWELIIVAVKAPFFGWLALCAGWMALAGHFFGRRRSHSTATGLRSLVGILVVIFVIIGGLHGLALRAEQRSPMAIVMPESAEVREAPGAHRKEAFSLQGGSRVRIVDRAPGWSQIRLGGGLHGWLPSGDLGELRSSRRGPPHSSSPSP
ncbi:MAG TPA: hypothetical protein ENK31_07975 [Nannocystis exedens]|nr:hypothetical protein [Nannocystis exedens]